MSQPQSYKDFLATDGEQHWQDQWYGSDLFQASDDTSKPKYYSLIEFPYPSGDGLHTGHPRSYTALDIVSRKRRMEGFNVLYPIGFDAFGLPAENFALKTGIHPRIKTEENIANFTRQLKSLGFSFDWSRVINTTDEEYYRWTQWIFAQLFKHGLAYKKKVAINYCTKDKVALANEEVVNGKCERCGGEVIQKEKNQWLLRITDYADRLDRDLDLVDFWDKIKVQQRNWIGKSDGAEVVFKLNVAGQEPGKYSVTVFTTRPDTIYGVTFVAISPELAQSWIEMGWKATKEVQAFTAAQLKERAEVVEGVEKEKVGIDAGITAINPINGEEVPVWIVNYVLGNVGTGAIMGVPAHDERDYEFAEKYQLPIKSVVIPSLVDESNPPQAGKEETFRNMVLAIVHDPRTDKYLTLKWKAQPWTGFITGGVEADEDRVTAAQREITEETGYSNIRLVRSLGMTEAFFYAAHKGVNRKTLGEHFLFELVDDTQIEIANEEQELHEVQWVTFEELKQIKLQHAEAPLLLERIATGKNLFVGDGILINSEEFDGLTIEAGTQQIVAKLKQVSAGHATSTYKLRDWVFSRQRYWGEPIPLVHCDHCAAKKQKVLLIHGFESTNETGWLPWLKTELEKQGFEVIAPTMSTAKSPSVESWLAELSAAAKDFGEDDIIVGYSLGGQAAMHLIKQLNTKIAQLFIIGNVPLNPTAEQWTAFEKVWPNSQSEFATLKSFMSVPVDYEAVTKLVGAATVVISQDDYIFGPEAQKLKKAVPAGWRYLIWDNFGHFSDKQQPELLELISRAKVSGWRLVPELPLVLPEVEEFRPGEDGESPLALLTDWVNTTCPTCGQPATRETDTMPQWAGSSWYFLRYIDPKNTEALADPKKLEYWFTKSHEKNATGIDWYNGGMEHTTLHLLYSRFWHKFLFDINVVPTPEPYAKRTSQGMILGEGGVKMSKSLGNVVNPDEIVKQYGADTMRLYEMFMGPFDQAIPWDPKSIVGVRRFLEKTWKTITESIKDEADTNGAIHSLIKKVSDDIEGLRFNTAISSMMEYLNGIQREEYSLDKESAQSFLKLLSPFAPHIVEELWQQLGHAESITHESWPVADESKIITDSITIAIQVNGKVRGTITVAPDTSEAEVIAAAKAEPNVAKYLEGAEIKKTIYVPGKLVSFVI
ncbi:MAG: class I tRNA ligase family protein [Candidatus Buchananbacteria bacterium]|nr:class I tRNA ligase family protein [Candidatus Buchananbacteria bacterium]